MRPEILDRERAHQARIEHGGERLVGRHAGAGERIEDVGVVDLLGLQVALVSFSDSDALQGRLGARLVKTWDIGASLQPRPLATWLRANLWHEFLNGGDTTLAGLNGANPFTFAAPLKGTWAEIGGGATGAIGRNTALFATTAYQHSVDGNHQYAWTGRAEVTFRW